MHKDIKAYNTKVPPKERVICAKLAEVIGKGLKGAEGKVWHGHPVWFIEGNPIVGYAKRKVGVTLLFWSGQSFAEEGLLSEGSFKAAQKKYLEKSEVKIGELSRWLTKAKKIQWDYKNIVKRKGKLVRL